MPAEHSSDEASLAEALGKLGARLDPIIALLDHLQGAFFWIKDTQGRFRWVNTAVVLRRGLKHRDEMIGTISLARISEQMRTLLELGVLESAVPTNLVASKAFLPSTPR